jgi:hypothetical protein
MKEVANARNPIETLRARLAQMKSLYNTELEGYGKVYSNAGLGGDTLAWFQQRALSPLTEGESPIGSAGQVAPQPTAQAPAQVPQGFGSKQPEEKKPDYVSPSGFQFHK